MSECRWYAAHKSDVIVTGFGMGVYYVHRRSDNSWGMAYG